MFCRPTETGDADATKKKDPKARPRPLYDIPYMFDAREFLRKKLIGKKVKKKNTNSVTVKNACFVLMLLHKGCILGD